MIKCVMKKSISYIHEKLLSGFHVWGGVVKGGGWLYKTYSQYLDCNYRKDDCSYFPSDFIINTHYLVFKDFSLEQLENNKCSQWKYVHII